MKRVTAANVLGNSHAPLYADGATDEGGDKNQCEAPKDTTGAFVLGGCHFDRAELWDLSLDRVVLFLPISAWRKGEVAIGLAAMSWEMFFVGSMLVGRKGVAYLKRRFFKRRERQRSRDRT